jgi:hypothetical protein
MAPALGSDHAAEGVMRETLSVGERDAPAALAGQSWDYFSLFALDDDRGPATAESGRADSPMR